MKKLRFAPYEGTRGIQEIKGRDSLVILGSAYSEDLARGFDISMAHLSEVAFWPQGNCHNPEDLLRSISGTVTMRTNSFIALESTANGRGNFFHTEWLRAMAGQSNMEPVFIPWYDIDFYKMDFDDAQALWESMDDYEYRLWDEFGCTLEQINWYHHTRQSFPSHALMMAEFPTTSIEAFSGTSHCVFDLERVHNMQPDCRPPLFTGNIVGEQGSIKGRLNADGTGQLQIWQHPERSTYRNRYIASVDVGGRSPSSDWSVITVLDRKPTPQEKPEVVAQWRGHIDHDLLAWKAAQLAHYYKDALLVFESNTLETEHTEGDDGTYILELLNGKYRNLYVRGKGKLGFQTNKHTKSKVIHNLISLVRDGAYVEHDHEALDEMSYFEMQRGGRFGAVHGHHDDIVMSRAIGLYVAASTSRSPNPPRPGFWDHPEWDHEPVGANYPEQDPDEMLWDSIFHRAVTVREFRRLHGYIDPMSPEACYLDEGEAPLYNFPTPGSHQVDHL